jgi:FG-GAP-like repeat/Bacterial Ig-like domain (group 3)
MAYDAAREQVVLFGAAPITGSALPDTWVWDGANWTQKSPVNSPPLLNVAMTYDAARQQVVLFGGLSNAGIFSATWVWDGTNWTEKAPAHSPSARFAMAMAYDGLHQNTVLFGGSSSTGSALSDTWIWDGTDWTQESPLNTPPARSGASMAYDAARAQVVLFGGTSNPNSIPGADFAQLLSDTWVWDGANWSQKPLAGNPSPRIYSPMVYDATHQEMVLFGGGVEGNFGPPLSDIWAWDGSNWTQQSPANSPPARTVGAMAYDAAADQVVFFGGANIGQAYQDTWIYYPGNPPKMVLSAASNPATFGLPVALTATLNPTTATGPVTFYDGTTVLGAAPINGGSATLTTIALPVGAGSLRAYYGGDAANSSAFSPGIEQTVQTVPGTTFVSPAGSPFPVGLGPFAVVVADFNGDNEADLAVANAAGGNVTVLLGDGNGGFAPAPGSPFQTGNGPFSLAVGDFNRDGKQDLAIANAGDNTVTILLGNGSGGFTPASGSPFKTGSGPLSIAVADFNGDGRADLATLNTGDGSVTILMGNGSGQFTPAPSIAGLGSINYVVVSDFNEDGIPDLAIARTNFGGPVGLILGNGDGTFSNSVFNFGSGGDPVSLAAGDFNGDGVSDLASANLLTNNITVVLAPFDMNVSVSAKTFPAGASPESVAIGDFNGDGKLDLAVANSDSNNVTLLFGDGTGKFTAAPVSPLAAGDYPFCVAVGDFNGDGRADLAVVNFIGGNVTILLGKE